MSNVDFIIVGQGIAGTLLAYELEERQKSFIIFDDNAHNASLTAAGMVNPVVLKRFSPVWNGKQQILKARETMAKFSEFITEKTNYQFDILRIFNNEQERTTWANKISLPQLEDLLDTTFYPSPSSDIVAPFGVGKVHYGGRMDLHTVLSSFRKKFKTNNQLVEEQFDYRQLVINDSIIHYKNITAHNIVFCEGYGLKNNPYFNELPLNGNKGEILHVRIPNLQLKESVKSSVFIMPLPEYGDDMYFIGATYNWTDKDNIPTDAGREELLNKLQKILTKECFAKVEVVEHRAGMRPTVSDRRPLLGRHSQYKNVFVFNGLGTRGVMLGITMATHLAEFICDSTPLPAEVDITRFS